MEGAPGRPAALAVPADVVAGAFEEVDDLDDFPEPGAELVEVCCRHLRIQPNSNTGLGAAVTARRSRIWLSVVLGVVPVEEMPLETPRAPNQFSPKRLGRRVVKADDGPHLP